MAFKRIIGSCRPAQLGRIGGLFLLLCGSAFFGQLSYAQNNQGQPAQVQQSSGQAWLKISEIRWRAPIPGQVMAVAYVSLRNPSDQPVVLTEIDVDWARKAEFHTHLHEQGMMRMRRFEQLAIQPGELVTMGSGGLHIMLFGVQEGVAERRSLPLTLRDSHGRSATMELLSGQLEN